MIVEIIDRKNTRQGISPRINSELEENWPPGVGDNAVELKNEQESEGEQEAVRRQRLHGLQNPSPAHHLSASSSVLPGPIHEQGEEDSTRFRQKRNPGDLISESLPSLSLSA